MNYRSAKSIADRAIRRFFFGLFAVLGALRWLLSRTQEHNPVGRILIVRVDLLGDVLFSLEAVTALRRRYPDAYIAMLTLPYTAPLAAMHGAVDEVFAVDTNRIRTLSSILSPGTWREYLSVGKKVRAQRFDLAVSVHGRMGSLCAFLSGARHTVGYAANSYPLLLTDTVPGGRYRERMHEIEYVRRLSAHAGGSTTGDGLAISAPENAILAGSTLLAQHGIRADALVVVIHAGSGNGAFKRWPPACWGAFADAIHAASGARIVLVGGPGDEDIGDEVLRASRVDIVSLIGVTDVPLLAAVIARADLVASGDSGPLHLAVALGRPVVAVYGPTDPLIYGPFRPAAPAVVHRHDLPCSPCYPRSNLAACPLGDPICMRLVTVPQLVASALQILRQLK